MATRTVSVKIAIEGYQEYRNTIANLNAQNKLLEARLKDLDREYGSSSTSVDKLAKQQGLLIDKYNLTKKKLEETDKILENAKARMDEYAKAVEDSKTKVYNTQQTLNGYTKELNNAKEALDFLKKAEGDHSLEIAATESYIEEIQADIDHYNEKLLANTKELSENTKQYTNIITEVAKLESTRSQEKKDLEEINDRLQKNNDILHDNGDAHEDAKDETKKATDAINDNTKAQSENEGATIKVVDVWGRFKDIMGGVVDVTKKVADAVADSLKAYIDYEAAFTNVEKTVDGTQKQMDALNKSLKEMSSTMPYAASDIANIASLAGQLGVGIDDIAGFTEVMLGLGTATNLTGEEASTMLAQFQNITGFETDKIKNIASVIVDLGNNSATTEKDIMEMAQRFASAGTLAGLSAPEILGMSAALSSVGIRAEAGGSTLSKMTQMIQSAVEKGGDGLEDFARVAGVSSDKFAKAWKESPVEAINMFLSGLHGTFEEGDSVLQLLDDLGLNEVRLRNSVSALAASEKGLAYYVNMANDAFKDTSAYDTEVGRFLDTTQSSVQILKNNFELLKIQVGEQMSPAFDGLVEGASGLIEAISSFLERNPFLIEALSAIIGFFGDVAYGIADILNKNKEYIGDVERFGQVAVNTESVIDGSTRAYAEQTMAIEDTVKEADKYIEVLQNCEADGKITREEQEKYNEAIEELKKLFPDLNIEIDKHTGMIKGGTEAVREQIKAWQENAIAEARAYRLTQLYKNLYDAQEELSKNTKELKNDQKALERVNKELNAVEDEYAQLMGRNIPLTDEQRQRRKELEEESKRLKKEQDELNQKIADHEVAIIADRDAMVETQTAIKNWEESTKNATKATDDNTRATRENADAHEEAVDSYDQSEKAEEYGKKTISAYVNGEQVYMSSSEYKAIQNAIRNGIYASFGDAYTAHKKGQEIAKAIGAGISSSVGSIKEAGRQINEALANTLRSKDYRWKMKVQNGTASYVAMFAEGGVVNRATPAIVGEAGTEAIIPLKKLPDIMTKYMQNQQSMSNFYGARSSSQQRDVDTIVSLLNRYLPKMSNQQVVLDSTKLVGTLAPKMDTYFTNQLIAEGRGQ